jgi:hypothetical protein
MSENIVTSLGTLRRVSGTWLLWCDACSDWERLNTEQMAGRLSVNHAATGCPSRYHETHDFNSHLPDRSAA